MEHKDLHEFEHNLTLDPSFIHWVKSEFVEDNDKWSDFIDDNIEDMDAINRAIKMVRTIDFESRSSINHEQLWSKISSDLAFDSVSTQPKIKAIFNIRTGLALLAAACLALFLVFRPGVSNNQEIKTGIAQDQMVNLPDGSTVHMNAQTSVVFNEDAWNKDRIVNLEGMAFFEVKKGSKFTVKTSKGSVEVLGTSFNVDVRKGKFEVVCKTGKVKVIENSSLANVILSPGDKSVLEQGTLTLKSSTDGMSDVDWIEGIYTFEKTKLTDVIDELENQFDIKISLANDTLQNLIYTGFFTKKELDGALYSVTWPLGLTFKKDGKNVVFDKEK